jgi:hypothetical protein
MSQQPTYTFNPHRILAALALIVALVLLIIWLVSASTLGFEKVLLFLFFDYVVWRALDVLLP